MSLMPSKPNRAGKNSSSSSNGANGRRTGSEAARRERISDLMKGSNAQIVARLKLALLDRGKSEARRKSSGAAQKKKGVKE